MRWYDIKSFVGDHLSMSHDALHIHLGIIIFLGAAWIFRRKSFRWYAAWTALFSLTLSNEALDAYDWIMWTGSINWLESLKDIANTMAWPSVIVLVKARQRSNSTSVDQ